MWYLIREIRGSVLFAFLAGRAASEVVLLNARVELLRIGEAVFWRERARKEVRKGVRRREAVVWFAMLAVWGWTWIEGCGGDGGDNILGELLLVIQM